MRVLVTGVSGLVGSNVAAAAVQQSWEVTGCYHEEPVWVPGARTVAVEMADRRACVRAALECEPDVIVHAAGGVSLTRYERDPLAAQLDLVGAEHTLAAARAVRARYVLVSCDLVHSGFRPDRLRFNESDPPNPVNAYGRSKLACEEATMRSSVRWLIARPGEIYGVNASHPARAETHERHVWERSGMALRLLRRLRNRALLAAPMGLRRSPTYAWDYAERLCELIAQGCEGIYNMGGPRSLDRLQWLELLADAAGCPPELVIEGSKAAFLEACGEDPHLCLPPNAALCDEKTRAAIGVLAIDPERGVGLMCERLKRTLEPIGAQAR